VGQKKWRGGLGLNGGRMWDLALLGKGGREARLVPGWVGG
jgi:hypothetical protein